MPRLLALVLSLVLVPVLALPASAHTTLVASSPAAGAVVADLPEVRLTFSSAVQPGLSTVAVTAPDGAARSEGTPVARSDREVAQAVRGPLLPGTWTVAFRVVAADGHPVTGSFTFVAEPPPPSPPAVTEPTHKPTREPAAEATAGAGDASDAPAAPAPEATAVLQADDESGGSNGGGAVVPVAAVAVLAALAAVVLWRRRRPAP